MGSIAQGRHVLCAHIVFALLLWAGKCEKRIACVTAAIATVSVVATDVVVAAIITVWPRTHCCNC